jgi:hypothetical protein
VALDSDQLRLERINRVVVKVLSELFGKHFKLVTVANVEQFNTLK